MLYRWLNSAPDPNGFFHPAFDRKWKRIGESVGSVVSQSRLIFNFSTGFRLTGDRRFKQAALQGADFLINHFWDSQYQGFFQEVKADGTIRDSRKDSYGQAFAVFGLTHAYTISHAPVYRDRALKTLDLLNQYFQDPQGGFQRNMTRDFKSLDTIRSQNPVMHLFEALLELALIDASGRAAREAVRIENFVFERLYDAETGCLPEFYDLHWIPLVRPDQARIDIGHQFEWAFLLSEAQTKGISKDSLIRGERLLKFGLKTGFDPAEGGIFSPCGPDAQLLNPKKGWWEQCEAARALYRYTVTHNRKEYSGPFKQLTAFIKNCCIDSEFGGWFSAPAAENQISRLDKGSIWKVDYHVTGMCMEFIHSSP